MTHSATAVPSTMGSARPEGGREAPAHGGGAGGCSCPMGGVG